MDEYYDEAIFSRIVDQSPYDKIELAQIKALLEKELQNDPTINKLINEGVLSKLLDQGVV